MRVRLLALGTLATTICAASLAQAKDDIFKPPRLESHGRAEQDLCFRGATFQEEGGPLTIADPAPCRAQNPHPRALPVHAGCRVVMRLPLPADAVTVQIGAAGSQPASREGAQVWTFRMPAAPRRGQIAIAIDYSNGHTAWTHPYTLHRHH
jgi:hypothetical protein